MTASDAGGDRDAVGESRLVFASFYTLEYAEEAAGLRGSLNRLGIVGDQTRIEPRASLGRWEKNTAMKIDHLLAVFGDLRDGDRVVWVDADARLDADPRRYFLALPDAIDAGFHWRAGAELLSGTVYLRVGGGSRILLDVWKRACARAPEQWDQRALQGVVHALSNLVTINLPPELCAIPDLMPGVRPVIRHRQASRRLKSIVGP